MTDVVEVKVETAKPYSVWVGAGILEQAGDFLGVEKADVAMLVSDDALPAETSERAVRGLRTSCKRLEVETISGGEEAKTMDRAERLLRRLAQAGAHRTDLMAALGGGTVGDLAGFVAATYHRGMAFAQMPTTLLAMVDAAVGGKTGVNIPEGKNLIGAFHQPVSVIADVSTLETLPRPELASGLAEVVKHGLIDDGLILAAIARSHDRILDGEIEPLIDLVTRAVAVKARIVSRDETEQHSRMFLNYGHTLGHALESLGGYTHWRHGEAVSLGMMFAAHLARLLGFEDRVALHKETLQLCELPVRGADEPFERVFDAMSKDKKYSRGIRFVILETLGHPRVVTDIAEELLRRAYVEVSA